MSITFRKAIRQNVSLLIGLAGGTGSGKSYSAMRLAAGIAGTKPFAVIDTEAGRALHYADEFTFDHADLKPPFRPSAYEEVIIAADKAGYPVIVVDSMSHEYAGESGILEWSEEELDRLAGEDWKKREACKMLSWVKPKTAHKHMVQRLLQIRAHLILCFRAEEKIEQQKGADGKTAWVKKTGQTGLNGWFPVCEKNLPYELTASFLLMADSPGVPNPIKLQRQHRELFPLDRPIDERAGELLAQWSKGGDTTAAKGSVTLGRAQLRSADEKALRDQGSLATVKATYDHLMMVAGEDVERVTWIKAEFAACWKAIKAAEQAA